MAAPVASAARFFSLCQGWRYHGNMQLVPPLPAGCSVLVGHSSRHTAMSSVYTPVRCSGQPGLPLTQPLQQQCAVRISTLCRASAHSAISGDSSDSHADDANNQTYSSSSDDKSTAAAVVRLQPEKPLRVERLLANLGYGKRQECATLLKRKRVVYASTGKPAKVGEKALAGDLLLDGQPLDPPPPMSIILHKPVGYVVTSPDDENVLDPKIYDLLPHRYGRRRPFLSAVGRLDKETSGLLLLTDDGKLLHSIQSPARGIWKLYTAELAAPLVGKEAATAVRKFASGTLLLQGDRNPLLPAGLRMLTDTTAQVAICEGRYHQIRRMFAAIDHEVVALHRHAVGGLSLTALDIPVGDWRYATIQDLTSVLSGPDLADTLVEQQHVGQHQQEQQDQPVSAANYEEHDGESSGSSSSSSSRRSRKVRNKFKQQSGEDLTQQPQSTTVPEAPAGAWFAEGSTSRLDLQEDSSIDDEDDDYDILADEEQAVKRYRNTSKWAKRRAAIARGVKSVQWQHERAPDK